MLSDHLKICSLIKVQCSMCLESMQRPGMEGHTCKAQKLLQVNKMQKERIAELEAKNKELDSFKVRVYCKRQQDSVEKFENEFVFKRSTKVSQLRDSINLKSFREPVKGLYFRHSSMEKTRLVEGKTLLSQGVGAFENGVIIAYSQVFFQQVVQQRNT